MLSLWSKDMCEFMYEWIEKEESFCVFDGECEPILETLEYLKYEKDNGAKLNTQENKAVSLRLWFEFLSQEGLSYLDVENKHIPQFRDWLKTEPSSRDIYQRAMMQKEHIISSTWMQYQSRIAKFYDYFSNVKGLKFKIKWKDNIGKVNYYIKQQNDYMFKEKNDIKSPDSRSIEPKVFVKIREQTTNKRDALILDLVYVSGLRRGELSNVDYRQFKQIDRKKSVFGMHIHDSFDLRKDNQTKTGGRCVFIPSSIAERISSYILHDRLTGNMEHFSIFTCIKNVNKAKVGDPLKGSTFSAIFKRAAKRAGYEKYTIHDCRHSMVTNSLSSGVGTKDVMDQAGHKNFSTTMKYRSKNKKVSPLIDEYCHIIMQAIK